MCVRERESSVCVCERDSRERERMCVCVCVCVRERGWRVIERVCAVGWIPHSCVKPETTEPHPVFHCCKQAGILWKAMHALVPLPFPFLFVCLSFFLRCI